MKKRKFFIIKDDSVHYISKGWKDKSKSKWGTKGIGRGNHASKGTDRTPK